MRRWWCTVALVLACAGCTGSATHDGTARAVQPGCGLLPVSRVVGLIGNHVHSTGSGSVQGLRARHRVATCRSVVRGHPERYVALEARYHPQPFRLPKGECSEGWVYAGTPAKYTPACQQYADGRGTTELIVRWQPYLMKLTIGRENRDWGGDPERALAMSRTLAQRLGVAEASGDG
jgi:hypothetical protein